MSTIPINLLNLLKSGNNIAFRQFYDLFAPRLFDASLKILKDQKLAEEVVQESFIKIFTNRAQLQEDRDPWPLLFVIAKRLCLNQLRNSRTALLYRNQLTQPLSNVVEEHVNARELEDTIMKRIAQLPTQQRTALELSRIKGLTHKEIAVEMGISTQTVKNHITQALSSLRSHLSKSDYNLPLLLLFFFPFR
ncbi:RNA polymerase sigma-70 factor [Sphingobacteriaceae bacterium WQ 2009]|uniref:RNA polymerase sigma-70 factor n=1 Tax=Rhinopithecimicrobium faecis TaxID=2820698 RepID=A0A8T4HBR3_9SPHI|nr:RNA polymerase sigma-70 factor [Sphingobacteriaceae bacterium WQ 2009]